MRTGFDIWCLGPGTKSQAAAGTRPQAEAIGRSPRNRRAAVARGYGGSGLYVANTLSANMAKLHFASNFHEFVRDVQDIAGGLLVTQPTWQDWQNEKLRPHLDRYLGGAPGWNAETRMRLWSMLHHTFASDFAGWHEVCTIHAEGSFASQKMMLLHEAPMDLYCQKAREIAGLEAVTAPT